MSDSPYFDLAAEEKSRRWNKVNKKLRLLYCGRNNRSCSDDSYPPGAIRLTTRDCDKFIPYGYAKRESSSRKNGLRNLHRSRTARSASEVVTDHLRQSPDAAYYSARLQSSGISVCNSAGSHVSSQSIAKAKLMELAQEHIQARNTSHGDIHVPFAYSKDGEVIISTRTMTEKKRSLMMKILLDDNSLLTESVRSKLELSEKASLAETNSNGATYTSTSTESKHSSDPFSCLSYYSYVDKKKSSPDNIIGRSVEIKCSPTLCADRVPSNSGWLPLSRVHPLNCGSANHTEEKGREIVVERVKDDQRYLKSKAELRKETEQGTLASGCVNVFSRISELGEIFYCDAGLDLDYDDDSHTATLASECESSSCNFTHSAASGRDSDQLTSNESLAVCDDYSSEGNSQIYMMLTRRRQQDQHQTPKLFPANNEKANSSTQISTIQTEGCHQLAEGIKMVRSSALPVPSIEDQDFEEAVTKCRTRSSIWIRQIEEIELTSGPIPHFTFPLDENIGISEEKKVSQGSPNADAWLCAVRSLKQ